MLFATAVKQSHLVQASIRWACTTTDIRRIRRTVDVVADKTTDLNVTLKESGEKVAGPFGDIELKGHPRAAVLLNGKRHPTLWDMSTSSTTTGSGISGYW